MTENQNFSPAGLVTGLNAVVLIAEDFPAQVAFYREVMGFRLLSYAEGAAFFGVGEQKMAVFERGHHPEGDQALRGASHGLSHIEFNLPAADIQEMASRLQQAGAQAYRDNFQDADGNLFHFVSD